MGEKFSENHSFSSIELLPLNTKLFVNVYLFSSSIGTHFQNFRTNSLLNLEKLETEKKEIILLLLLIIFGEDCNITSKYTIFL